MRPDTARFWCRPEGPHLPDCGRHGHHRELEPYRRETGGPSDPAREKGFGSTLIEYSGKVTQQFDPEGLHWTLQMALSAMPRPATVQALQRGPNQAPRYPSSILEPPAYCQ